MRFPGPGCLIPGCLFRNVCKYSILIVTEVLMFLAAI